MTLRTLRSIGFGFPFIIGICVWFEVLLSASNIVLILASTLGLFFLGCSSYILGKITRLSMILLLVITSWWLICVAYLFKFIAITSSVQRTSDLGFLDRDVLPNIAPSFSVLLFLFLSGYIVAVYFCSRYFKIYTHDLLPKFTAAYYKQIFYISCFSLLAVFVITSAINLSLNIRSGGQDIDEIQLPFKLRGMLLNLSTSLPALLGGVMLISAIRLNNKLKTRVGFLIVFIIGLLDIFVKSSKGALVSWLLLVAFIVTGEYLRHRVSHVTLPSIYKGIFSKSLLFVALAVPAIYFSYHLGTAVRLLRADILDVSSLTLSDFVSHAVAYLSYINEFSSENNEFSITALVTPERLTGTPSALASYSYGFAPLYDDFFSKIIDSISHANIHLFEYFGTYEVMRVPGDLKMGVALSTLGFLYVFFGFVGVLLGTFLISVTVLHVFSKLINSTSVTANSMAYSFPILAIGFFLEGSLMTMLFSIVPFYLISYYITSYLVRRAQ